METMKLLLMFVIALELGLMAWSRLKPAKGGGGAGAPGGGGGDLDDRKQVAGLLKDTAEKLKLVAGHVEEIRKGGGGGGAGAEALRNEVLTIRTSVVDIGNSLRNVDRNLYSLMADVLKDYPKHSYNRLDDITNNSRELLTVARNAAPANATAHTGAAPAHTSHPTAPARPESSQTTPQRPAAPQTRQAGGGGAGESLNYARQANAGEARPRGEEVVGRSQEGALPVTQRASDPRRGEDAFRRLQSWLSGNLREIMERSRLNPGIAPQELVSGAPPELGVKAEIIDRENRVLGIGARDQSRLLAVVLPGAFVGATYEDWFDVSKGTNRRVEETITPALVEQVDGGFRIQQPGKVRQD